MDKFNLETLDRIVLGQLLATIRPPANYVFYTELRKLREAVSYREDEAKAIDLHMEGDRLVWDETKAQPLEVEIGARLLGEIRGALQELDESEKLLPEYIPVYEKFVIAEAKHE